MHSDAPTPHEKPKSTSLWLEIERRMETAQARIDHVWMPSPDEMQQTLEARARALAREPVQAEAENERIEVVEFILADEHYALESSYIREVIHMENLTPLPCTPVFVLGIVNVRGEILSVIDIKKFFELPEKGLTDLNKIIVLQSGKMVFGILADVILGVRRVRIPDIQPSLPTLTGIREAYLKGVTPERMVILDAEKLLVDENIVVQEQVGG